MSTELRRACCSRASLLLMAVLPVCSANAAEQCVPNAELNVPATTEGLYVNVVTGVFGQTEASVPGFDIDIYASANSTPSDQLKFYWGSAANNGAGVATVGDTYALLGSGAVIGESSLFTRAAFTGDTSAWQAGVYGYLGMRFRLEPGTDIRYGWVLLSTTAPLGFPATIHGWCYEDSGAAITTPTLIEVQIFRHGFEQ